LGNTNFSFVSPKARYDKKKNCGILIGALNEFGIDAELKGRNDIVLGPTKISGHAYKYNNENALHHGTLLREVSMENLQGENRFKQDTDVEFPVFYFFFAAVLSPNKAKLQSKGVGSVEARVSNLAQVSRTAKEMLQ
jgi:lipoate-protein ligase A